MKRCKLIVLTGILLLIGCGKTAQAPAVPEPTALSEVVVTPHETPLLTELPAQTSTPEPTPTQTPAPTPEPIVFTASEDLPLPDENSQLQRGQCFWIDGTVTALEPLNSVTARVIDSLGETVLEGVKTFGPEEAVREYKLLDMTFSRDIDCVAEALTFQDLDVGDYTLSILAAAGEEEQLLAESAFHVTDQTWLQLQPNSLRGNYTAALAFFGSPERFMFRYKLRSGSVRVDVDKEWLSKYRTKVKWLKGEKKDCHVDAVPYFEQARRYLENTYIHISGKRFDTGALRLSAVAAKLNGTMVCRFVGSGEFLSHHSFGTAIDINASFASNRNKLENRERIYREVTENLTYNGIVTVKGKQCYDFTYTGSARREVKNVPEPLMNYLLYELAFYRAGFAWGVYYPHTSDAMHFTLTELSPELFTDGPYAMRKVFRYIEDGPEETPKAAEDR